MSRSKDIEPDKAQRLQIKVDFKFHHFKISTLEIDKYSINYAAYTMQHSALIEMSFSVSSSPSKNFVKKYILP